MQTYLTPTSLSGLNDSLSVNALSNALCSPSLVSLSLGGCIISDILLAASGSESVIFLSNTIIILLQIYMHFNPHL